MRCLLLPFAVSALVACSATRPAVPSPWQEADGVEAADAGSSRGLGHRLLWYLPNRISDVLDVVRARARVGPGFSVGVRATELVDVYLGSHVSVFAGIPGPRRERAFNWPLGLENKSGLEVSVVDATVEGGTNYGLLEVGLSTQLLLVGVDVGVDPWEVVDLALGLLTIDLGEDDL